MRRWFVAVLLTLLVGGCGFEYDETLVARYRLVAVDVKDEMMLCWGLDSGSCEGAFPRGTTYAAGFDDKYVVAIVHPDERDRQVSQYFYILRDHRTENSDDGFPYRGVRGPFTAAEFAREKSRLHLPGFTRVFDDLK